MKLTNTNPLGDVFLPIIGRVVAAGEEFEVADEIGAALLDQVGNYAPVSKAAKKAAATTPAEGTTAQEG